MPEPFSRIGLERAFRQSPVFGLGTRFPITNVSGDIGISMQRIYEGEIIPGEWP
jgi:hypothetical protein